MKKTALITGGSRGIGRACAIAFAAQGYNVAVNYGASKKAAEEVKNIIISSGGSAEIFCADVSDERAVFDMISAVKARFGGVNVLVANAGESLIKQVNDTTKAEWEHVFAVNAGGVRNAVQAVLPFMLDEKNGRIITVSSVWGEVGASCEAAYSASKAAVIGYTKALAKELAPSGITVNCVSPGVIDTDMNAHLSPADKAALEEQIPACRFGTPEEVAAAVLFFASDGASYITGEVLGVNGGFGRGVI